MCTSSATPLYQHRILETYLRVGIVVREREWILRMLLMMSFKFVLPLVVTHHLINERLLEDDLAERHGLLGKVMALHMR